MPPLPVADWHNVLDAHLESLHRHSTMLSHVTRGLQPETPETTTMLEEVRSMITTTEQNIANTRRLKTSAYVASSSSRKRSRAQEHSTVLEGTPSIEAASIRSLNSTPKKSKGSPIDFPSSSLISRKLFIDNLPIDVTEDELKHVFTGFTVTKIEFNGQNVISGRSVFVYLATAEEAKQAMASLSSVLISGRTLNIRLAESEPRSSALSKRGSSDLGSALEPSAKRHRAISPVREEVIEYDDISAEVERRLLAKEQYKERVAILLTPKLGKRRRDPEDYGQDLEGLEEGRSTPTPKKRVKS